MDKQKLYEKGLENLTNVLPLLWFGFAAYGVSALRFAGLPIISILYLLFAIIMLGFVLRKHLCTHCYYYDKLCGTGCDVSARGIFIAKWNESNWFLGDNGCKMRYICKASAAK